MKTINRYIIESFLTAFTLCWLVLTFVLSIGLLVKVTSLIAKGMPVAVVGSYFLAGIPETIGFTIPLAVLISALLVFGRLSTDSEIAAMRACGINLLRVMLGPLLLAVALSALCLYIHNEVVPRSEDARAQLALNATSNLGLDMMEPGIFNDGPSNMKIWFASRTNEWLTDLRMYDKTPKGQDQEIRAARARVTRQGDDLNLELYDAVIDPAEDEHPGAATASRLTHKIPDAFKPANRPKKVRTSGSGELRQILPEAELLQADPATAVAIIKACPDCARLDAKGKTCCLNLVHELARELIAKGPKGTNNPVAAQATKRARGLPTEIRVELYKRTALGCAAFFFALIGMPLGIRSHRRESTIGVAIGLGIALLYYMAMILADAFKGNPGLHPEFIVWLPAVICVVVAAILIPRNQ